MASRWNGDEWRWRVSYHQAPRHHTISVIESAERREDPPNAHRVPFGFGIREPAPEAEPLTWEGDGG